MDASDDPYEILGLSRDASEADIKKAYRKLALKNHPDKQPTPEEREKANGIFAKISNAYQILSDSDLRRKYECQKTKTKKNDDTTTPSQRRSRTRHYSVPREEEASGMRAPFTTSTKTTMKSDGTKSTVQSTGTKDDGTTFSFSFTSDTFNSKFEDPFEMFRKMYREEFGKDFESSTAGTLSPLPSTRTRTVVQQKGTLTSPTSRKTKLSTFTKSPARSSITSKTTTPTKVTSPLFARPPLLADEGTPYVSMSSSTKQIQHPDGRIETITEITKTLADGTMSTQRKSSTSSATTGSYKTTSSSPIRMSPRQVPKAIKTLGGGGL